MKKILMTALGVLLLVTLVGPLQAAQKAITKYVSAGEGIGVDSGIKNFNKYPIDFIYGDGKKHHGESHHGAKEYTSDSGNYIKVEAAKKSDGAVVTNNSFNYACDYDAQVKVSAGHSDSWNGGIMFNMSQSGHKFPYGYGLTYFNYWPTHGHDDHDGHDGDDNDDDNDDSKLDALRPDGAPRTPLVVLWQNIGKDGHTNINWIAYARVDGIVSNASAELKDALTRKHQSHGDGHGHDDHHKESDDDSQHWNWYLDTGRSIPPTLAVKVIRSEGSNQIRAYIGGPSDQGSKDIIPTNFTNRGGYPVWSLTTPASDIKWPSFNGTWPAANDYFTMLSGDTTGTPIQWVKNPNITTATLSSDTTTKGTIPNAVITSTVLANKDTDKGVGLFFDGNNTPVFQFTDLGIKARCASITTCSYEIEHADHHDDHGSHSAHNESFNVETGSGCAWTTSTDVAWITNVTASGSGNGTVSYKVSQHSGDNSRTGHIYIKDSKGVTQATHTVTQRDKDEHDD